MTVSLSVSLLQAVAAGLAGLVAQNIVTIVVGLVIAFESDWRLTLVVLACAPIIAAGGYIQMKVFTGQSNSAKASLENVRCSGCNVAYHASLTPNASHAAAAFRLATLSARACTAFALWLPLTSPPASTACTPPSLSSRPASASAEAT